MKCDQEGGTQNNTEEQLQDEALPGFGYPVYGIRLVPLVVLLSPVPILLSLVSLITLPTDQEPAWQMALVSICGLYVGCIALQAWRKEELRSFLFAPDAVSAQVDYTVLTLGVTGGTLFLLGAAVTAIRLCGGANGEPAVVYFCRKRIHRQVHRKENNAQKTNAGGGTREACRDYSGEV